MTTSSCIMSLSMNMHISCKIRQIFWFVWGLKSIILASSYEDRLGYCRNHSGGLRHSADCPKIPSGGSIYTVLPPRPPLACQWQRIWVITVGNYIWVIRVWLFATPWTVAYQAPLSMGFSRQECWSGLPFPSPGDLPDPDIKPGSPTLRADALPSEPPGKPNYSRGFC